MLALRYRVVGRDDVAFVDAFLAQRLHRRLHDEAEIGCERRVGEARLGHDVALRIDEADRIVAHFVVHDAIGGAPEIVRHLVGIGEQRRIDQLERDWVHFILSSLAPAIIYCANTFSEFGAVSTNATDTAPDAHISSAVRQPTLFALAETVPTIDVMACSFRSLRKMLSQILHVAQPPFSINGRPSPRSIENAPAELLKMPAKKSQRRQMAAQRSRGGVACQSVSRSPAMASAAADAAARGRK